MTINLTEMPLYKVNKPLKSSTSSLSGPQAPHPRPPGEMAAVGETVVVTAATGTETAGERGEVMTATTRTETGGHQYAAGPGLPGGGPGRPLELLEVRPGAGALPEWCPDTQSRSPSCHLTRKFHHWFIFKRLGKAWQ